MSKTIDLSFKAEEAGTYIVTKKGFIWTKMPNDKWLDTTSRILWNKPIFKEYKFEEAIKYNIPTKEEIETACAHGVQEVFDYPSHENPYVTAMTRYWTSTKRICDAYPKTHAYIFQYVTDLGRVLPHCNEHRVALNIEECCIQIVERL